MSIDFEIPAEAKAVREKVRQWVRDECVPAEAELLAGRDYKTVLDALRTKARAQGLWCPFIPTEHGGMGLGPLANALVQMELGESYLGALSMNTQGPDDATMLTLLTHGTDFQKEKFLKPLLNGEKRICYSMTEKAAGADATGMQTRAVKDGNENYVLNGEKWFSSAASVADIALVMAKTDPDAPRHQQFSTFIVELPNPGYRIIRDIQTMAVEGPLSHILGGGHSEIEIKDLVVPADNLLGGEGRGFEMGQHRLAYGRPRHGPCHGALHLRQAACRAAGGAVDAGRLRQRTLHGPPDAPPHRLQGRKGPGPAAGKLHRQGLPGPHGPQSGRHRHPAARRPGLQPGHAAGRLVHPHPRPAPGRRSRRSPPLDGWPQRHQGLRARRHHGGRGGR